MARKRTEPPAYQYHVSGQAKMRLGYVNFYLGKHGIPESYTRYYALLSKYNAKAADFAQEIGSPTASDPPLATTAPDATAEQPPAA